MFLLLALALLSTISYADVSRFETVFHMSNVPENKRLSRPLAVRHFQVESKFGILMEPKTSSINAASFTDADKTAMINVMALVLGGLPPSDIQITAFSDTEAQGKKYVRADFAVTSANAVTIDQSTASQFVQFLAGQHDISQKINTAGSAGFATGHASDSQMTQTVGVGVTPRSGKTAADFAAYKDQLKAQFATFSGIAADKVVDLTFEDGTFTDGSKKVTMNFKISESLSAFDGQAFTAQAAQQITSPAFVDVLAQMVNLQVAVRDGASASDFTALAAQLQAQFQTTSGKSTSGVTFTDIAGPPKAVQMNFNVNGLVDMSTFDSNGFVNGAASSIGTSFTSLLQGASSSTNLGITVNTASGATAANFQALAEQLKTQFQTSTGQTVKEVTFTPTTTTDGKSAMTMNFVMDGTVDASTINANQFVQDASTSMGTSFSNLLLKTQTVNFGYKVNSGVTAGSFTQAQIDALISDFKTQINCPTCAVTLQVTDGPGAGQVTLKYTVEGDANLGDTAALQTSFFERIQNNQAIKDKFFVATPVNAATSAPVTAAPVQPAVTAAPVGASMPVTPAPVAAVTPAPVTPAPVDSSSGGNTALQLVLDGYTYNQFVGFENAFAMVLANSLGCDPAKVHVGFFDAGNGKINVNYNIDGDYSTQIAASGFKDNLAVKNKEYAPLCWLGDSCDSAIQVVDAVADGTAGTPGSWNLNYKVKNANPSGKFYYYLTSNQIREDQVAGFAGLVSGTGAGVLDYGNFAQTADMATTTQNLVKNLNLQAGRDYYLLVGVDADGSGNTTSRRLLSFRAAASGAETEGAETEGAETEGAETEGAETEGAETEGAETDGGTGPRVMYANAFGSTGSMNLNYRVQNANPNGKFYYYLTGNQILQSQVAGFSGLTSGTGTGMLASGNFAQTASMATTAQNLIKSGTFTFGKTYYLLVGVDSDGQGSNMQRQLFTYSAGGLQIVDASATGTSGTMNLNYRVQNPNPSGKFYFYLTGNQILQSQVAGFSGLTSGTGAGRLSSGSFAQTASMSATAHDLMRSFGGVTGRTYYLLCGVDTDGQGSNMQRLLLSFVATAGARYSVFRAHEYCEPENDIIGLNEGMILFANVLTVQACADVVAANRATKTGVERCGDKFTAGNFAADILLKKWNKNHGRRKLEAAETETEAGETETETATSETETEAGEAGELPESESESETAAGEREVETENGISETEFEAGEIGEVTGETEMGEVGENEVEGETEGQASFRCMCNTDLVAAGVSETGVMETEMSEGCDEEESLTMNIYQLTSTIGLQQPQTPAAPQQLSNFWIMAAALTCGFVFGLVVILSCMKCQKKEYYDIAMDDNLLAGNQHQMIV